MASYANKTSVPVDRTRSEIEQELRKRGAIEFGFMTSAGKAMLLFRISDAKTKQLRSIRISLVIPDDAQSERSRWRALLLVIKAKLVACDEGISTIEREFFADVVNSDGRTVFEVVQPQIAAGTPLMLGMK